MGPLLLAVVLVAVVAAAHYWKLRKWAKTVDALPGPPSYPVIGNVIDFINLKFNMTAAVELWTKMYGDTFRVWLGTSAIVVITKPEDVEIILSSNKHVEKAILYRQLHSWIGQGLLTSTGKRWFTRRKLITPTFHFKILDQFVDVFNRNSKTFVQKLLAKKEAFNVHSLITLCTLDIICETAMGTKVDAQKDSTSPYVSAIHDAVVTFHLRTMTPWLQPEPLFRILPTGRTFFKAVGVIHKYSQDVIQCRKLERASRQKNQLAEAEEDDMGVKKREAFLDHLLDASESSSVPLSSSDIQEEVDTFMFEGHDTTGAALSFIMYCVAANPEVQERMFEEVKDVFGDSDRAATTQDIQNLKYTERVVKETLRIYPSVPLFGRLLREDVPITGGYVVPAGCNVSISCLQMGRDAKIWPDPERFDPDRFLPENTAGRHPYAYVPFSAGPRNCIGQKFAMMEMKSTISQVVRHCKLDVPFPGYKPRIEGQVILKAPDGVILNISPR